MHPLHSQPADCSSSGALRSFKCSLWKMARENHHIGSFKGRAQAERVLQCEPPDSNLRRHILEC